MLLSARADGEGMIEVAVSDQGLGIPLEALPRLFAKFYRVDGAERETIKGTGLGLAICRELVVRHGGSIWAESAGQGRGARFCFTLPAMTPLASVVPLPPGAPGVPSTAAATAGVSPLGAPLTGVSPKGGRSGDVPPGAVDVPDALRHPSADESLRP